MPAKLYWTVPHRVRFFTYHFLNRLARFIAPPEVLIDEHVNGFFASNVIAALVRLDVAQGLAGGPRTSEEVAQFLRSDVERVDRLLYAARSLGYVRKRKDRWYGNSVLFALRPENHQALFAIHLTWPAHAAAWGALDYTISTGASAFHTMNGMSLWEWLDQNPADSDVYMAMLEGAVNADMSFILSEYSFPRNGVVCDIAGGTGASLAHILDANGELSGVLFERPTVIESAKLHFEDDLKKRVKFVAGDMFTEIDIEADLYFVKNVLHDWDDERCIELLRNIHQSARPGSRVLVAELFVDRKKPSKEAVFADLEAIVIFDQGRGRTPTELQGLLRAGGFQPGRVATTPLGLVLVEATR